MKISALQFAVCVVSVTVLSYWVCRWYWARQKRKRWIESLASKAAIKRMSQSRESHSIQSDRGGHSAADQGAPRQQVSPQGRPRQ